MHEALQVLLQEGRAHARNGDAVAVAELEHRVAVHIRGDRRRQFLHVLNVGEVVELDRVVLRIEVVDRLRAFAGWNTKVSLPAPPIETEGLDGELVAGGSKITTLSPTCLTAKSSVEYSPTK